MIKHNDIAAFLYFGYIPSVLQNNNYIPWLESIEIRTNESFNDRTEPELIDEGVHAIKSVFKNIPAAKHIVPISGGLDSRAVLAGLLDAGLRDHIIGVTFGVPGNLNYEIGALVSQAAGIRHVSIDLGNIKLDTESLVRASAKERHYGWIFDFYYNRLIPKKFGSDAVYWSGYMGDPLAGSHLSTVNKPTWEEATHMFVQHNKRSDHLACPNFDPVSMLPSQPPIEQCSLGFDDQLDFVIRQESYIKNIVTVPGYDYRTPFMNPHWLEFILNVPRSYRYNQSLYHKILLKAYPKLFTLPTRNTFELPLGSKKISLLSRRACRKLESLMHKIAWAFGLRKGISNPRLLKYMTYIDFDEGFRHRKDLNKLANENINDLLKRNIITWVDIEKLWKQHQRGFHNYGDSISMLVSLEIILKSCNQQMNS